MDNFNTDTKPIPPDPNLMSLTGPTLAATSGDEMCSGLPPSSRTTRITGKSNFYHDAQLSADASVIITHNEDQRLRTYLLPEINSNDDSGANNDVIPPLLAPYTTYASPSNIISYALFPSFNRGDSTTTWVLTGAHDQPIKLRNASDYNNSHTYHFINDMTEQYIKPHSLIFTNDCQHFIVGSMNKLGLFKLEGDGKPMSVLQLARDKQACHGIISSLAIEWNDGILAAGTFQRQVSLFGRAGAKKADTTFSLADPYPGNVNPLRGAGVTKMIWSPCGTYLCTAERWSDVIQMWDIRNLRARVAHLIQRKALTAQRIGFDVSNNGSFDIYAGGTDGTVSKWDNVGHANGEMAPTTSWLLHEGVVSGTLLLPGNMMATCSGSRFKDFETDDSNDAVVPDSYWPDNRLLLWNLS
ncbi:Guanine nucleotide-binding protein negative regulator 1 [Acrodontium crateriforme]|uniref:Guanine nucleotide-binding protein negative regulator 1 n=1 Tax=Acrodontium crateriforme TaxID=150365 RepID=A0AAQ3MBH3_9PEZI|nr:Guanine nucleotide-binding protein negative regulator 1 [Acrodontium crateriforme]